MAKRSNSNIAIVEDNKNKIRKLEEFYVNGKVTDLLKAVEEEKERKVKEIIEYAESHIEYIYNKEGEIVKEYVKSSPIVISNYFFKPICPLGSKIPIYSAEKLALVYEYYMDLVTEVNDKIGIYPASLIGFCKMAGISVNTLREYKNSNDLDMRNIVEKIYEQIGDENLTMSQLGGVKERSTIFRLKSQNEMVEKEQPSVNISLKQTINTDKLNENLDKYKDFLKNK